jgi:hypothetical protein
MRLSPDEIVKRRKAVDTAAYPIPELMTLYSKVLAAVAEIDEWTDESDLEDIINCARAALGRPIIERDEV